MIKLPTFLRELAIELESKRINSKKKHKKQCHNSLLNLCQGVKSFQGEAYPIMFHKILFYNYDI